MYKYKAQASQEGLVVFIIVLVILSAFLIIANSNTLEIDRLEDLLEDEIECQKLSNHIRGVFILGDDSQSSVELIKNATIAGDLIVVGGAICNSCCNFTRSDSTNFNLSGTVTVRNNLGNIHLVVAPGDKQHHESCSSSSECSASAPLCCFAHGGTVCEEEGHHSCSSSTQVKVLTISSTTGHTCDAGCSTGALNDRDGAYESLLNKGDVLPMSISNVGVEGGSVSDVKVSVDYGQAGSGISANSMELYISTSQSEDAGTIYCKATYTPPTGTASTVFDCEDNPVSGGLDTIAEVDSMFVHIDNEDTASPQSFKVDWVSVNVTYSTVI